MRYEAAVKVRASVEEVWAVLTDVERWPEWTRSIQRVECLEDGPFGLGSTVRIKQPRLPAAIWRVTEFDPQRWFSWTARGGGVTSVADHRLAPGNGEVAVTVGIRQSGPLAPVLKVFYSGLVRDYVQMEAQGLRRRCEAG